MLEIACGFMLVISEVTATTPISQRSVARDVRFTPTTVLSTLGLNTAFSRETPNVGVMLGSVFGVTANTLSESAVIKWRKHRLSFCHASHNVKKNSLKPNVGHEEGL